MDSVHGAAVETGKAGTSKQRILEAGVSLFARKGYGSAGLRELAEEAGVNLAMINYFYGSKKGLLKVILDSFFTRYLEIAETELSRDTSLDDKVTGFIRAVIDFFDHRRDYLIVALAELPHDDPDIIEYKAAWINRIIVIFERELCAPLADEHGLKLSPTELGPVLLGMVAMRFLVDPVIREILPSSRDHAPDASYPDLVASIFVAGIKGVTEAQREEER